MSARLGLVEPDLSTVDCTGITTGNEDLAESLQWKPPAAQERAPLPIYPQPDDLPPPPPGGVSSPFPRFRGVA